MVTVENSRCSSMSSELGRLSAQRSSRMSDTPPPHPDQEAPDFTEDNALLAQYPGNYRELITNVQLQDGLAEGKIQQLDGIQSVFIRHILKRRDIFCQLPAKSGKTAIFVVATLQMLNLEPDVASFRAPSVVVVAPTRELASQIADTYQLYGKRMPNLSVRLFIGGLNRASEDVKAMRNSKQRLHVVVATPGRLKELIRESYVHVNYVKHMIFDEADTIFGDEEMRADAHFCFTRTERQKQTMMFGATFSGLAHEICVKYLRLQPFSWTGPSIDNPRRGGVINHRFYHVHENSKMDYLEGFLNLVLEREPERQVLIFVDTRERCDVLSHYLEEKKFDVIQVQGGLRQNIRFYCFGLAKENRKKLIVTTDLFARGVDIPHVSVIVNYDCPKGFSGNVGGGRHDPVEARHTYYNRTNRCGRDIDQSLVLTLARDAGDINFLRTEVEQNLGFQVIELTKE
ncbi:hypothetical protein RvY_18451-2 [Ramazzottius varieornatus]|uniref:ATP-dependent RNA helicase n=1 Tax=Ramazzottius varieornatus TaxID=947166 RepID=A0A1D1W5U1_RAMVA|nr:hypothetical protein RvY_18451-2 [Ramazzottius varieornatus]